MQLFRMNEYFINGDQT